MNELTRRRFLQSSAAAAGALLAGCGPEAPQISDDVLALHRDARVLDLHLDTLLSMRLLGYEIASRHTNRLPRSPISWHMDLPRAREGGLDGAVMGLVISPREVREELMAPLRWLARLEDERGIDQTLLTLDVLDEAAQRHADEMRFCRSGSEMRTAMDEGRFAAFAGLEGSHGIESDLQNVHAAYQRGLRMIGLTHFQASSAAYPMTVAAFDGRGLTPFGRDLVTEMERMGMVVDLAHVNEAGVEEALGLVTRPFVVSHTACRALFDFRRNLSDAQIRAVAERGGVIGLCLARGFIGRPGVEGFVDHIEHAIRVGGVDCVALGSDWDGAIVPVEGLGDVTGLPRVTQVMLERGHSEAVIRKALGENALRVLTEVCG